MKMAEQIPLQQLGVQGCHPVNGMTADDGQIGHAYPTNISFTNNRHLPYFTVISGKFLGNLIQKTTISASFSSDSVTLRS